MYATVSAGVYCSSEQLLQKWLKGEKCPVNNRKRQRSFSCADWIQKMYVNNIFYYQMLGQLTNGIVVIAVKDQAQATPNKVTVSLLWRWKYSPDKWRYSRDKRRQVYFRLDGSVAVGGGGGPRRSSSSRCAIRMSALSSFSGSITWYLHTHKAYSEIF